MIVAMLIVTGVSSVSIDASSARGNNASSGGCLNGGRREETQTDSSQVGRLRTWFSNAEGRRQKQERAETRSPARARKKKPAAICKSTTQLMGIIIIKQCLLRTEQETRSLCGAIFDTVIMATEHDVVNSMREQTRRYNEGVQATGKGHTLGPPRIWAWGGLIAGQKQGAAVGAANAATLTGYLQQLDRSGVRVPVVSALQQLGAARKYGRAPPTQLSRKLQQWLDTLLDK